MYAAQDKQARLLSTEAGHFSLFRALHLADFITEMNGTFPRLAMVLQCEDTS
jgi:hypothetical protein